MSVVGFVVFKVTCANLERSVAFYEQLGFKPAGPVSAVQEDWIGELYGAKGAWPRVQAMTLGDDPRGVRLELLEWSRQAAPVAGPTAPGAGAVAVRTDDLRADVARLKQQGVGFHSEIVSRPGPKGESLLATLQDPDGFGIQLFQFVKAETPSA